MANYITTDTELQSVANAIRTKGGTSAQLEYPSGFVTAIGNIPTGGGTIDPSWLSFSGDVSYFNYGGWFTPYLQMNKTSVSITNVSNVNRFMGGQQDWSSVNPDWNDFSWMTVNVPSGLSAANLFFSTANYIEKLPHFSIYASQGDTSGEYYITIGNYFLASCSYIKDITGVFPNGSLGGTNNTVSDFFANCQRLRQFPDSIWKKDSNGKTIIGNSYQRWFQNCYVLDKLENIPIVGSGATTTSSYSYFINTGWRLSKITFQTNNGTPFDINVTRNVTWDLRQTGYCGAPSIYDLTNYGMSSQKQVTDSTSYNLLKNDPDWWTNDSSYSRFNHDSAVALINSLPNNTNTSTKVTIQLNGNSGSSTDGGAISTLTSAELAVATNKNWAIQFV